MRSDRGHDIATRPSGQRRNIGRARFPAWSTLAPSSGLQQSPFVRRMRLDDVQQPLTNLRTGRCKVDGRKSDRMSLNDRRFIDVFPDGRVQQQTFGPIRNRTSPTSLGTQVRVDLKEISAAKRLRRGITTSSSAPGTSPRSTPAFEMGGATSLRHARTSLPDLSPPRVGVVSAARRSATLSSSDGAHYRLRPPCSDAGLF